jgi:CubicO group peptidase (beta-lactamase class C family)
MPGRRRASPGTICAQAPAEQAAPYTRPANASHAGEPDRVLRPRALARFALLFQRNGEWHGRQVIPAAWVERSLATHVADTEPANAEADFGYGYQWWVFEHGGDGKPRMVGTWGWGGQFALLVPALDLIAVFTGWNVYEGQDSLSTVRGFYERIVVPSATR